MKNKPYNSARETVVLGRKTEERKVLATASSRISELKDLYKKRDATKEEFEELQKIEELVNEQVR